MNPFGLTCSFENEKYRDCDRTCGGLIMKYNDDFLETKSCVPVTGILSCVFCLFCFLVLSRFYSESSD